MIIKFIIVAMLLVILFCLGSGLVYLIKDNGKSDRTLKALTWRIAISITLFLLLFLAFALGIIQPHTL